MIPEVKTLEELSKQNKVFLDEVARYLEDCVARSLSISGEEMIQLIERCEPLKVPNQEEIWTALAILLTKGMSDHFLNFREIPAAEYRAVVNHINGKIGVKQAEAA